jgi:hypothetical protein
LEAFGEQVPGDAEVALDLLESPDAAEQVTQD